MCYQPDKAKGVWRASCALNVRCQLLTVPGSRLLRRVTSLHAGCAVLTYLAQTGQLTSKCRMVPMTLPDRFIEHGTQKEQLAEAGLSAEDIARTALSLSGKPREKVLMEKF